MGSLKKDIEMNDEVVEAKIGIGGFKLDLVRLYRKWRKNKDIADNGVPVEDVMVVAKRFRDLFAGHELKHHHAIDIYPPEFEITLDKLTTDEKILGILTPQVLDWTAEYFGVRRDWLDGSSQYIYEHRCYCKHLKNAIDDAVELAKAGGSVRSVDAFLLINSNNHDLSKDRQASGECVAFVMRTVVKELNSEDYVLRLPPILDHGSVNLRWNLRFPVPCSGGQRAALP